MLSARLPSRSALSSRLPACLPFRSSFRFVVLPFRVSPFFVSGGGAWGDAGVELLVGSGRGSWGGRLFAWSVRVCSLVSRGRSICSIVSVSGAISDVVRAVSGRPILIVSCSFSSCLVRFPSALVRFSLVARLAAAVRRAARFSSRASRQWGGAAAWRLLARPCSLGYGAGDVVYLVPSPLLVCSARGAGRRGCLASRLACLESVPVSMCGVLLLRLPCGWLPVPMSVGADDVG